jgi:hypothetical protein
MVTTPLAMVNIIVTSASPKKANQSRSNTKVMLTDFFYVKGVVYHEFLPPGPTVNRHY